MMQEEGKEGIKPLGKGKNSNCIGGDAPVAEQAKLSEETALDPSHPGIGQNKPAEANGESNGDIEAVTTPDDTSALSDNSQEVDSMKNRGSRDARQPMDEYEAPQTGYDSFVRGILGYLGELRNLVNDSDDEEVDQEGSKANGDDEREPELTESISGKCGANESHAERCGPVPIETIKYGRNIKCIFSSNDLTNENSSEDGVPNVPGLNAEVNRSDLKSKLDVDGVDEPVTKHFRMENNHSSLSGHGNQSCKGISPVENTCAMDTDGAPQTEARPSTSPSEEGPNEFESQLPVPENFREHSWSVEMAQSFKLGTSGFSYTGGIADKKMHGVGRLVLGDDGQFMEGVWMMNRLVELYSCQLIYEPGNETILIFKRQNDYLLSTLFENHYVARVILNGLEDLDFADDIAHVKKVFFGKLTILELVVDGLAKKKQVSLNALKNLLSKAISEDADPKVRTNVLFLLRTHLKKPSTNLSDIFYDENLPMDVFIAAADLLECENRYLNNMYVFSDTIAKLRLDLQTVLESVYNDGIAQHRQVLIDKCPRALPSLLTFLRSAWRSKIMYITSDDMRVFDHLVSQPCFEQFKAFFVYLVDRFRLAIKNIKSDAPPSTVIPVMPPIYGFLFKSFWEIISEIIQLVDGCRYEDMLKYESGYWKLKEFIRWPQIAVDCSQEQKVVKFFSSSEKKSSLYHRSLEVQYKILFKIMDDSLTENFVVKKKHGLTFYLLEQDLSWWEKGLKMVNKRAKRLENMPSERLVWLYLLDHTIHNVFKYDPMYPMLLKPYKSLLQGQISFIEKSPTESHETFRVMTHNIIKFITSTAPYFREARDKPGIDVEILVQQMWTFSAASQEMEEDPATVSNFRDLIAEYNRYLSLRLFLNIDTTTGHFSSQILGMMQTFMRIVVTSLKKTVPTTALVVYLRSLNDFLDDFKNIDFLAMWFVKGSGCEKFFEFGGVLEKVNNKISTGGNCSYRVVDIEKHVQFLHFLGALPVPDHYIILVVSNLLDCIETCLNKRWQSGEVELHVRQLACTGLLLDAIRRSFMYLKEQPDYVDFETFKKESVDPFVRLVRDCATLTDLKKRAENVRESYWYIRKMDEIGIDRALEMFKSANTCHVSNKLLDCYNLYLGNYDEYIAKYGSLLSGGKSHAESLGDVIQMVNKATPMHFSMWTEEFKTKKIPVMLAGLGAVWSILVSKDVSSTGKFLKPHCIQILCVLRLLSVDQSRGADNHLAQVLTGQGKSLILGLLSSVLAMTGHKVRVLCYSDYLSTRDQSDFYDFFQAFELTDQIEYGTFEKMADSFLSPVYDGGETSLRQLVSERVLNHSSWSATGVVTPVSKDTVLLIDEVDVFFTDKFYGNAYLPAITPGFEGLGKVQEFIWTHSNIQKYSAEQIYEMSRQFISNGAAAGSRLMLELNGFLDKPGTFPLLRAAQNGYICVTLYNNKTLFNEHLLQMARDAVNVRCFEWARSGFDLTPEGIVRYRKKDGVYSENHYVSYQNVFNYFRLKGSNFDTKGLRNYGYLNLRVGEISYARLPSQFQLILGVSGTLTNLSEHERSGIKFYSINTYSVLPSFFGACNLVFDKERDFYYFFSEQSWMKQIYDRANEIVESRRAVLIFFELDTVMNLFAKEYKTKFDRIHEITGNTCVSLRDGYVDEAGLPCTVTLATRDMGRGVDYKSSLSVEKNGGVHVIQTFYSTDVKEEVQIKGRTARKDNKGSYELMIHREHLIKAGIIPPNDPYLHNYSSLDSIRQELSNVKGRIVSQNVVRHDRNHTTTMKYFGLM